MTAAGKSDMLQRVWEMLRE